MTISNSGDDGTSNAERISAELQLAALHVTERFPGYRGLLAVSALECYLLTAEHDEQRININQKYDEEIKTLVRNIIEEGQGK